MSPSAAPARNALLGRKPFCALPFTKIKVDPSGNVSMCCFQSGCLGNVFTTPLEQLWHSSAAREVRVITAAGDLHERCVGWGGCPYLVLPRHAAAAAAAVPAPLPIELELDLPNTHCNIGGTSPTRDTACFMCPRSAPGFVSDVDLSLALADRLRPLMPHLHELRVQGVAEPFWRDRLFTVLDRLGFALHASSCHFSTYTNGTLLSAKTRRRFLAMCPSATVLVSLDAAKPETYRRIRRLDLFSAALAGVRGIVAERAAGQQVAVSNNVNLLNLHEVAAMVDLAADLGVDWVEFNPTHDGGTGRTDIADVCVGPDTWPAFRDAQHMAGERGIARGIPVHFIRPLTGGYETRSHGSSNGLGSIGSSGDDGGGDGRIPARQIGGQPCASAS